MVAGAAKRKSVSRRQQKSSSEILRVGLIWKEKAIERASVNKKSEK